VLVKKVKLVPLALQAPLVKLAHQALKDPKVLKAPKAPLVLPVKQVKQEKQCRLN
jgi:hypothetical protein